MKNMKHIYIRYCKKYGKNKINIILFVFLILTISLIIIIILIFRIQNNTCYNGKGYVIFTNYWIPKEGEKDLDDNDHIIYLNGPENVKLLDIKNNVIKMVSKITYNKFREEGTGILENGIMINLGENNNRFEIVNKNIYNFGVGSNNNPLMPFVSIATNDLPINTKLYIKELDGFILPNNKTHNGCVRVDDTGYGLKTCHIDFFVLKYLSYEYLQKHLNKDKVMVKMTNCQINNYTSPDMLEWI